MPNLVGIGLSQVPTNSMLGGLAYQDPEHASIKNLDLKNLSQINSEIADTATDVFVYDTSKDSDGGAWRKRTTHTSWYNETLGTATRGTRKEFPAVAVIVAEQNFIKIYDGDDPDLPMWMVFNTIAGGNSQGMADRPMVQVQGIDKVVHMLNGILATGTKNEGSNYGQPVINFISEKVLRMDSQGGEGGEWMGNIAQRNDAIGYRSVDYDYVIAASLVNDVAMTVLPNAPIDSATGLPIPTIAVATGSGLSVIKDDGSVYDVTGFSPVQNTGFSDDKLFIHTMNGTTTYAALGRRQLTTDIALGSWEYGDQFNTGAPDGRYIPASHTKAIVTSSNELVFGGGSTGLFKIQTDDQVEVNGDKSNEKCEITTSYNTGWMHGDIKGAFLSDTDTTNVSAVVVNSATSSWSQQGTSNWTITSATEITVSSVASGNSATLRLTTDSSKQYVYSFNITVLSDNLTFRDDQNNEIEPIPTSTGVYTGSFTGTSYVDFTVYQTDSATVTSIDIRESEEDRSVNANDLGIYGTVTKSAVATGAEMVAYSGFSTSNYLQQPYNTDYSFGTGDFYVMTWVYPLGTSAQYDFMLELNDASTNNRFYLIRNPNGRVYVPWNIDVTGSELPLNKWSCVVAQRKSGTGEIYVNGEFILSNAWTSTNNLTQTGGTYIGVYPTGGSSIQYPLDGKLSLMRIGAGAISREQIKKMYEDEKFLFQENAKATLYGSSDAVTALAFDEVTDQLHVGTSSGRSDFQGLRRINNTTTAVTTAISAHDEFIIEQ